MKTWCSKLLHGQKPSAPLCWTQRMLWLQLALMPSGPLASICTLLSSTALVLASYAMRLLELVGDLSQIGQTREHASLLQPDRIDRLRRGNVHSCVVRHARKAAGVTDIA